MRVLSGNVSCGVSKTVSETFPFSTSIDADPSGEVMPSNAKYPFRGYRALAVSKVMNDDRKEQLTFEGQRFRVTYITVVRT
jgi:hypothetical protein